MTETPVCKDETNGIGRFFMLWQKHGDHYLDARHQLRSFVRPGAQSDQASAKTPLSAVAYRCPLVRAA
jgi:hypothetical protein